jgi:hypothetical protein
MEQFRTIVRAHGYTFREVMTSHSEPAVRIERISPRAFRAIDCEYWRWSIARDAANGVVVSERVECAI